MNFEIVYQRVRVCTIHAHNHKARKRRAYAVRKRLFIDGREYRMRPTTDIAKVLFLLTGAN